MRLEFEPLQGWEIGLSRTIQSADRGALRRRDVGAR